MLIGWWCGNCLCVGCMKRQCGGWLLGLEGVGGDPQLVVGIVLCA